MTTEADTWKRLEAIINDTKIDENAKRETCAVLMQLKSRKVNILISGATGSGKSSTINALFGMEKATVGVGVDPETMEIKCFELDSIILWDSPGFGDSPENDNRYARMIIEKLHEKGKDGKALIDLVFVIVDGSTRDMGTSFQLINEVVIKNLEDKSRILVAINQCDVAQKNKGWDQANNCPDESLTNFLDSKVESVKRRIHESTGVIVNPIYYSAFRRFNVSKVLSFIIKHTPVEKRSVFINNINRDPDVWKSNDTRGDYNKEIREAMNSSILSGLTAAAAGAASGAAIGSAIPAIGTTIGAVVGGVLAFLSRRS